MSYKDFSGTHASKLLLVTDSGETTPLVNNNKIEEFGFFHPKRKFYAYCVLFMACLFSTCSYFIYDCVGTIQDDLQTVCIFLNYLLKKLVLIFIFIYKQYMGVTPTKFGLLYSVYSFPNCILPFFGGI